MTSILLRTATRFMLPILILFSIFLFLRGHNEPGGGFIGGLVAAAAFALYALAYGVAATQRALRVDPQVLIGTGLLVAIAAGLAGLLSGEPFLTGLWGSVHLLGIDTINVGTPILFDIGVYLVVIGTTLLIVLTLAEE